MLFDLKEVFLSEGSSASEEYDLDLSKLELDGCFPFISPVKVKAKAENITGVVSLTLETEFDYNRPCDRCFTDVLSHISYVFRHKLIESLEEEFNDDYIETPNAIVDLDELVTSDIILELPHKYLCKEDCQGLCKICGKNLNTGDCGCDRTETDPRLDVLKQLLE